MNTGLPTPCPTPGVRVLPLQSPTLWPATTTNCVIVGTRELFVVDPAAVDRTEQARLLALLDALHDAGARIGGVLLTHHHRDHIGAALVVSEHFSCPVHAHALTFELLALKPRRGARSLADGDHVALGTAPDGSPDWRLEVLHTPGHARDHLCFVDSRYRGAFVGDVISTVSTIVIDPPEGHMATYLDSLARLRDLSLAALYPAHGPAHSRPQQLLRHYLTQRRQRETRLKAALTDAPRPLSALLPAVYGAFDERNHWAASRTLLAMLQKLRDERLAEELPEGWRVRTGG